VVASSLLSELNAEQQRAASATRGPVCILAGAGTGKTTTITHRIAHQVTSGTFEPTQILAVTFTDKAATELRTRLSRLGAEAVPARTFHAAALAQLRGLSDDPPEQLLSSKAPLIRQLANRLPGAYRFRSAGDLATEIEWAKNRRIAPADYPAAIADREPPLPVDLMQRIYREYEQQKAQLGQLDFEDLLERAIQLFTDDAGARERFRGRYRAFTVDEYQDVNLLQQTLLDLWLGDRDDLCVVGDDYQSIYGFTGATPRHLLSMPERYPQATMVKLVRNYRSSPQVLELANRLAPELGGVEKELEPTRPDGAAPTLCPWVDAADEARGLVSWIRECAERGVEPEEIAILYRRNASSEDYEQALTEAGIPYQVRGSAFLARPAARRVMRVLSSAPEAPAAEAVEQAARSEGWLEQPADNLGDQEATRQADLARLVALARMLEGPDQTVEAFLGDLRARFAADTDAGGVQLLTLHRAKGLEFDAVAIVRVEEGELPIKQAKSDEAVVEERRLLYVGLTRARERLLVSWHAARKPSRFLAELGVEASRRQKRKATRRAAPADVPEPVFGALREWRLERSRADGVPAYVVFHDATLEEIARVGPSSRAELASISGIGPAKLERYGEELLAALAGAA
jgi:DNA helicase-2/ATP-dependent DNA helicase PcrA